MDTSNKHHPLDEAGKARIGAAIGRIPQGLYVLTSRNDDRRFGMLVSWVQQVCFEPPMVSVAVGKGRPIMPLISDSHRFGLCQLPKDDKVILRRFAAGVEQNEDPFLGFELVPDTQLNLPILANVMSYLECEMVCHMDVEGDHDLFVGRVLAGKVNGGEPAIRLREDGYKY